MSFEELILAFRDHLRGLRRVPSTLTNYMLAAQDFARHCGQVHGCQSPHEVRQSYLGTYVEELRGRNFSRLTIYSRHRQLRTWFAWAHLRGHLLLDPIKDVHYPHPPLLPRGAPSEEQVAIFLAAPGPYIWGQRDRCLLDFLYCTGLRVGECVALDLPDLDLDLCQLAIHDTKTKMDRIVPFGEYARKLMRDYLDNVRPLFEPKSGNEQALWLTKRGQRCRTLDVQWTMRLYSKQLGFSITPHTLRHAYATHLLLRGASIVAVQALLGHTRLKSTQRYTHLVPTDLKKELFATHPRGVRKKRRKGKT